MAENLSELILSEDDTAIVPVPTPEWPKADGRVFVRTISAEERIAVSDMIEAKKNVLTSLVIVAACDAAGEAIFNRDQAVRLAKKSTVPLKRIYDAAAKLNCIGQEQAKELEKNSETGLTSDSA